MSSNLESTLQRNTALDTARLSSCGTSLEIPMFLRADKGAAFGRIQITCAELWNEIRQIMQAKSAFAKMNNAEQLSLSTFLYLYANVEYGVGKATRFSSSGQGPSTFPPHVWAYNFMNTAVIHSRSDAGVKLVLDIILSKRDEGYFHDFTRIFSLLLAHVEEIALDTGKSVVSEEQFAAALKAILQTATDENIKDLVTKAKLASCAFYPFDSEIHFMELFRPWWVRHSNQAALHASSRAASGSPKSRKKVKRNKTNGRTKKKNKTAVTGKSNLESGEAGEAIVNTGWPKPSEHEYDDATLSRSVAKAQGQRTSTAESFLNAFLTFYISSIEDLYADIESNLVSFDYTRSGFVLIHFIQTALRKVRPKLSILEEQTIFDVGMKPDVTYSKKTGDVNRNGRANSSNRVCIADFLQRIRNIFFRPASMFLLPISNSNSSNN